MSVCCCQMTNGEFVLLRCSSALHQTVIKVNGEASVAVCFSLCDSGFKRRTCCIVFCLCLGAFDGQSSLRSTSETLSHHPSLRLSARRTSCLQLHFCIHLCVTRYKRDAALWNFIFFTVDRLNDWMIHWFKYLCIYVCVILCNCLFVCLCIYVCVIKHASLIYLNKCVGSIIFDVFILYFN